MVKEKVYDCFVEVSIYNIITGAITNNLTNYAIILFLPLLGKQYAKLSVVMLGALLVPTLYAKSIIPGLQNTLASIHPLVILCWYGINILRIVPFFTNTFKFHLVWSNVAAASLVLGGLWAYQEFTWGGWWNWDGVELPLLALLSYGVYVNYHTRSNILYKTHLSSYVMGFLTILSIALVRFGDVGSVHSFVVVGNLYQVYATALGIIFYRNVLSFGMLCLMITYSFIYLRAVVGYIVVHSLRVIVRSQLSTVRRSVSNQHTSIIVTATLVILVSLTYASLTSTSGNAPNNLYYSNVVWVKPQTYYYSNYGGCLSSLIN